MSEQSFLTAEGAARMKAELEELKGPGREALAKRLREAVSQGDLSENADYTKAKEDQGFLEGRIQELEYLLMNAVIIEETNQPSDTVQMGVRVTVQEAGEEPETYHLVGAKEADPRRGKISNESPIGKALMGRHAGDKVIAQTPSGEIQFSILKIE